MKHLLQYSDFINENRSKYDSLVNKILKENFRKWIKDWNSGKSKSNFSMNVMEKGLIFDLESTLYFGKTKGFEILGSTGADARDEDEYGDDQDPYIIIDFAINKDWLPGEWQNVYMHLADVLRHEIEHITQDGMASGNYRTGKPNEDDTEIRNLINTGILPQHTYLMLPKEVDANLQGLRFESKKRKEPIIDTINRYLDTQEKLGVINSETRNEVIELWRRRAREIGGIPKF